MALVAIASPAYGHKGATGFANLRTDAVLTTGYVATDSVKCGQFTKAAVQLDFTIGSLTTAEIKPQYSDDGGTTWHDIADTSSVTAGVVAIDILVWQLDATQDLAVPFDVTPYEEIRFMVKGTGTVTSSTLGVDVAFGLVTQDSL